MNYSKWDNIVDSDDDDEKTDKQQRAADEAREDYAENVRAEQEQAEQWLRRNLSLVLKEEEEPKFPRRDPHAPPELMKNSMQEPIRKASKEDIRSLAMLMVITHFDEGETNLTRHPQILDLVRHHRWMEEDPGALELLCRMHNLNMKQGEDKHRHVGEAERRWDHRHRQMCLCAINALAAAKKANCAGGLLELINMICTPATPKAHELRVKWQKKEFGKDALFDSLFPDMKQFKDDSESSNDWWEIWLILFFIVAIVAVLAGLMYYGLPSASHKARTTTTAAPIADVGKPEL